MLVLQRLIERLVVRLAVHLLDHFGRHRLGGVDLGGQKTIEGDLDILAGDDVAAVGADPLDHDIEVRRLGVLRGIGRCRNGVCHRVGGSRSTADGETRSGLATESLVGRTGAALEEVRDCVEERSLLAVRYRRVVGEDDDAIDDASGCVQDLLVGLARGVRGRLGQVCRGEVCHDVLLGL